MLPAPQTIARGSPGAGPISLMSRCRSCHAIGRGGLGAAPARQVRMHQRTRVAGADEREHSVDERIPLERALNTGEPIAEDAFTKEQCLVGAAQAVDVGARKAAPAHPD